MYIQRIWYEQKFLREKEKSLILVFHLPDFFVDFFFHNNKPIPPANKRTAINDPTTISAICHPARDPNNTYSRVEKEI